MERNIPAGAVQQVGECSKPAFDKFARWQATMSLLVLEIVQNHARADLAVVAFPVGGEVYALTELVPQSDQERALAKAQWELLESTIHVWTENTDMRPENLPASERGNMSMGLSVGTLTGEWSGEAFFKVYATPAEYDVRKIPVSITFSAGARYTYVATANNWSTHHSGTFTLTEIPNVPNAYEYTHYLRMTPTAGDEHSPMLFQVRLERIGGALAVKPSGDVKFHGEWEPEQFRVEKK